MTDLQRIIGETVAQTKREIVAGVRAGTVPATAGSFSKLHDSLDANEYGNTAGRATRISWRGEQEAFPGSEALAVAGNMRNAVDAWPKASGLIEALATADRDLQGDHRRWRGRSGAGASR